MTQKRRKTYTYPFARKQMMVDVVVGGVTSVGPQWGERALQGKPGLQILLIRRGFPPYKGWWALPGGHNEEGESFELSAVRELLEETSLEETYLVQFHTFSDPGRDPREDTGSVAYLGIVRAEEVRLQARTDAKEARWFSLDDVPPKLAFDHREILTMGLERLRDALWVNPSLLRSVMPEKFSIGHLHAVYEQVLGEPVNRANFRRDYLKLGFLEELKESPKASARSPKVYRFR